MSAARDQDDVLNVAFDQWDQYATAVAAEGVHGITFGAFSRARLSAAGFVIVPRDGMKVPHDAAAAFWRRFQDLHNAETGARGFYESFGGGWNAMIAMLSAAEGEK